MTQMQQIAERVNGADALLVGAANGLSITEGINLFANDAAMRELFGDLQEKYGIQNLLQGMTAHWPSAEQLWGFWSRMVRRYCLEYRPSQAMKDLKAVVGEKDCFVVTSNGERHFEACGFDTSRVFEVEGDWLSLCCSRHCCEDILPGTEQISAMAAVEKNGMVPAELIPRCPRCGAALVPTMAAGVVDAQGQKSCERFLQRNHGKKLAILELGIGARNQLIKAPLMRIAAHEPNATYVSLNLSEAVVAPDIAEKSFALEGYLNDTLAELRDACAG